MKVLRRSVCCSLLAWCCMAATAGSYEDFFAAIRQDDASAVSALLRRGFDANTRSPDAQHGLYLAIREQSRRVVQTLVDWPKTEVESLNPAGESPLMMAALGGHLDWCKKLIARGAAALGDAELLALLLRTGLPGKNVLQLAQEVLERFGGLAGLLRASLDDLKAV